MGLLTIQEPESELRRKVPVVGIDLGTTHSLIALYQANGVKVMTQSDGASLLPSVVHYSPQGEVLVGQLAKERFETDPNNTLVSVKRHLTSTKRWETSSGERTAIEGSTEILKALMTRAKNIHSDIFQAVITVPAYFDEAQRQATKIAAQKAGIEVWRLLNEPTAAAIAYGLNKKASGTCLVFDLGGGTFDVSLLHLKEGIFEVLATGGDPLLGGDDIDHLVMNATGLPLMQARALKEKLSECEQIEGQSFTRDDLEMHITPLVNKMLSICQQVLKDAKLSQNEIDEVILVGGSTRIPFIQKAVEIYFKKRPLCSINPDEVVAIGAAIQASILSGQYQGNDLLLLDVTPLSLGIEMLGGLVEKIILRNSPIPAVATEKFTTYVDKQTGLSLNVVQGEREYAKDCRTLARFDLMGIPPMPAGQARIEVTFRIDADGLLTVEAAETLSGIQNKILVNAAYGLTEKAIEADVENSLQHQKEDRKAKQEAAKAQLEAALEKALMS